MKALVQRILAHKAKRIVAKYKPAVVAVTGSVGKTSTRNAIAAVLAGTKHVRTNIENYNNEFGVPLTIIGEKSPGKSLLGWLKVMWKAKALLAGTNMDYPNVLVLEYGMDHPGDLHALCAIAQPDISVLTAISPVHAEYFDSIDALANEKATLLREVKPDGQVVVNADDERVMGVREQAAAPVTTYGFSAMADVRGGNFAVRAREDFSFDPGEVFSEAVFDVEVNGEERLITLPNMLSESQASAALAAIAVGRMFGMTLEEIEKRLPAFTPQAGRMRPIPGIKGCLLLDDSYNAAPASMRAALRVLAGFSPVEGARRIAVLGKMAELGRYSEEEHQLLGKRVAEAKADILVTVGEPARDIRRAAVASGFPEEHAEHFDTSEEAGRWLDFHVKTGDVILVKGSQSARMEKVVKDLMAEPMRAPELLVRQYGKWLEE